MKITDNHKIKTSVLMDNLRKTFDVYSYWDNKELNKYFPAPKKTTTREFGDTQESDNKNKSRDDLEGTPLMTLREYIIAFEQYFKETGEHLDNDGWIIFQDRLPSGCVAFGGWDPGGSQVGFYRSSSGYRGSCMGARAALTSNLVPLEKSTKKLVLEKIEHIEDQLSELKGIII